MAYRSGYRHTASIPDAGEIAAAGRCPFRRGHSDTYGYISSSRSETYVDIVFGPVFGARYYFSDNFAVSGEFQISFVDTDSKGSAEIDRVSNAFYATTSELLAVYLYF
jgi:hypothetical protein